MSRKKRHEEHENEERWLLTYADMITLLLALFIILAGASKVDPHKYDQISQSLKQAFSVAPSGDTILNPGQAREQSPVVENTDVTVINAENKKLKGDNQSLMESNGALNQRLETSIARLESIQQQIAASKAAAAYAKADKQISQLKVEVNAFLQKNDTLKSQVEVKVDGRGLVLRVLPDKVLFQSGEAVLRPAAATLLNPLARLLSKQPNSIRIEGHTDNVPIHTLQFPSNWELSTARATSVVRYLIKRGVAANDLSAAGYADTKPLASNRTISGRARNRRIEIIVLRQNADSGANFESANP